MNQEYKRKRWEALKDYCKGKHYIVSGVNYGGGTYEMNIILDRVLRHSEVEPTTLPHENIIPPYLIIGMDYDDHIIIKHNDERIKLPVDLIHALSKIDKESADEI